METVDFAPKPEAERKPEWRASWNGIQIFFNPALSPGTVQIRDASGVILATIYNAHRVDIQDRP